jgi:hypothetical protein
MSSRSLKSVGVVVGVVGIMAASQAPALAAQPFDLNTDRTDGYAHAYGEVSYIDANSVYVLSYVSDRCDSSGRGDGEGAYLWLQIKYTDGSYDGPRAILQNYDNDGCDTGYIPSSWTYDRTKRISWVRLRLDEANGPNDSTPDSVLSSQKDNPYT